LKKIRREHCGIVLLAAGKSGRMGIPKQMLVFKSKTLLRHAAEAAVGTGMQPVIVVVGAYHSLMEKELDQIKGVRIVVNQEWEEGMASSIRSGVEKLAALDDETDGLIMMVCDQPFVSTELLNSLLQKQQETGKPVVACSYGNTKGVPALFDKYYFSRLLSLKGDKGARKLLDDLGEQVALVPFPQGEKDIDTREDFSKLKDIGKEKNA
jgi:molybdenum cofactor cytidylyltransferase